jgi:2-polyprenyl-3-methyl-5-hydroxy-6-metoxy-1,4-benzoquinol methylase
LLKKEINTGLAPKEHWDNGYNDFIFRRHPLNDDIYEFIRLYSKIGKSEGNVLEIGSFPGTYISEFGELDYIINGIDIQPRNATDLVKWLKARNYKVGDFIADDIFQYQWKKEFDIVCSFGFIEHFENFLDVIDIHAHLVNKDGLLIITTPNYRGAVQKFMHKYFTPHDYALHYIPSMDPQKWSKHLQKKGFEIIYSGYFGGMNFWLSKQDLKGIKRLAYEILMRVLPRIGKLIPFESLIFSKNCGVVARKK